MRTGEDIGTGWVDTTAQSIQRAKARLAELEDLLTEAGTANVAAPENADGHSPEPGPGSRAFDVGEPKGKRGTRSKQTEQRVDLSEADDLILPATDMGVSRDVVTRFAFGVLVLAALVLVVLHFSDIAELAPLARSARPEWLLLAVLAQAGTYLCAGSVLREALKQAGRKLRPTSLAKLGLVKLFADQAVPTRAAQAGATNLSRAHADAAH